MLTDLRLSLPNRPGSLIAACDALAQVGINVEGVCGDLRPGETWGYLHVLVTDCDAARGAIEAAGFEVLSEHEVDVCEIEDRPGALVAAFRRYSERGDNIEVLYMATPHRLVIGTESMRRLRPGVKVRDARYG